MPHSLEPPERLGRVGLGPQVQRILRHHILSGRFRGGEVLNTVLLAEELGVSRTPVRQALQRLEVLGLVELDQRGQYVVHQPTEEEMVEVFLLRLAIEWLATVTFAQAAEPKAIRRLERILRDQELSLAEEDPMAFLERDGEFHVVLAESAGLSRAATFLTELRDIIVLLGGQALARPGRRQEVLSEHRSLLEALQAGDPRGASRALVGHLLATCASISPAAAARLRERLAALPPFPPDLPPA